LTEKVTFEVDLYESTFSVVTVAVFFAMPPWYRCRWHWRLSIGVKIVVVNWKQVDIVASRLFRLSCKR